MDIKVEAIARTYTEYALFHKDHEYLDKLCREKGWLEDFFPDCRKVLTDEELISEAKRFSHLKEFRENEPNLYNAVVRRRILLRATEHMHRLPSVTKLILASADHLITPIIAT